MQREFFGMFVIFFWKWCSKLKQINRISIFERIERSNYYWIYASAIVSSDHPFYVLVS